MTMKKTRISVPADMKWFNSEVDLRAPEIYHLILWKYLGLIPPKAPGFKRLFYICCSLTIHILFTFFCPLLTLIYLVNAGTFSKFCEGVYLVITIGGTGVKSATTLFILPKLNLLSKTADRLHSRMKTDLEVKCLEEAISLGHKAFWRIMILFIVEVLASYLASLATIFYTKEPSFAFPAWYPFDWKNNRTNFWILYFHQFSAIMCIVIEVIASDTYVLVYIQYFIGHMRAFKARVKNICESSNRHENNLELIECITDHQHILRQAF